MSYLRWAKKTLPPIIAICGQSNAQGFSTGATSSLPDTDLEGDATVKTKPAGVSFYEDGSIVADWTNPFGPEVGIASVIQECTILKRAVNGSEIGSWINAGHIADAIADWDTVGVQPDILIWFQGEQDASDETGTKAAAYSGNLLTLLSNAKADVGGALGFVAIRIPTTDTDGYPYADSVRDSTRLFCLKDDLAGKCSVYLDPSGQAWHTDVLQADDLHLTGIGMYMYGKFIGKFLRREGYGS